MELEAQLNFCKKCLNKKLSLQTGIVCGLTNQKPTFEKECLEFKLDEDYVEVLDDVNPIEHEDLLSQLSEEELVKFRTEQNYNHALISGISAGILGALLWGIVTIATGYQIGYMAIAIGAGVGMAIRYYGKGVDPIFGITGGIIAVFSCLVGNFLSIVGYFAKTEGLNYIDTLLQFDYSLIIPVMTSTFSPMDLFFYAIAGYEGYKFAFRSFTEKELASSK